MYCIISLLKLHIKVERFWYLFGVSALYLIILPYHLSFINEKMEKEIILFLYSVRLYVFTLGAYFLFLSFRILFYSEFKEDLRWEKTKDLFLWVISNLLFSFVLMIPYFTVIYLKLEHYKNEILFAVLQMIIFGFFVAFLTLILKSGLKGFAFSISYILCSFYSIIPERYLLLNHSFPSAMPFKLYFIVFSTLTLAYCQMKFCILNRIYERIGTYSNFNLNP